MTLGGGCMTLTLSVLRCPDAVPPETKRVTGGEFRIGRGPDNDWIMPDPERLLSKRHCVIAFRNGGWAIADTSTNGTFMNRESDPLGAGQVRALVDGDRIRIGAYEIEARIEAQQAYAPVRQQAPAQTPGRSPFDDPFGDDVFAPPPAPVETFTSSAFGSDPLFGGGTGKPSITLPGRFDPLAPSTEDDFFTAPTQADHTPSFSDAFKPPAVHTPPAGGLLDDDWDLGFGPVTAPAAQPAFSPPPPAYQAPPAPPAYQPPAAPPQAYQPPPAAPVYQAPPVPPQAYQPPPPPAYEPPPAPPVYQAPAAPPQAYVPPALPAYEPPPAPPAPPQAYAPPPALPPAAPPAAAPHAAAPVAALGPTPFDDDPYAPVKAPAAAPPSPAPQAAALPPDALLAAFLAGAGMGTGKPENPVQLMQTLGAAFRATVSGIRQALIARASIKGEFRIEQTMIRSRGNNPLKFSADDDDALSAMLGLGRRMDMKADAAIADALRDMRLHELATMAAMQDAVRALMAQLDPAKLRSDAETGGGMTVLPAQKKARAFEAYEKLHDNVTRALTDDFDSVFGKSFARAYETALREISAKEPK